MNDKLTPKQHKLLALEMVKDMTDLTTAEAFLVLEEAGNIIRSVQRIDPASSSFQECEALINKLSDYAP